MEEDINPLEENEQIEKMKEFEFGWSRYLALTTAIIAVFSAVASLQSGSYADQSLLAKNEATLNQAKASDQWSYYQAKGIKANIADGFFKSTNKLSFKTDADKYVGEQAEIQKSAKEFDEKVKVSNESSDHLFEKHHRVAFGVTFLQIAVALSAMSALLKRKSFWMASILSMALGLLFFFFGLFF